MRITKVNIPATEGLANGLSDIKMDKLYPVVLIAGENGAGKTRLLDKIKLCLSNKPKPAYLERVKQEIKNWQDAIASHEASIQNGLSRLNSLPLREAERVNINAGIDNFRKHIDGNKEAIKNHENFLKWNLIETSEPSENYQCVDYVPKILDLKDCNTLTKGQLVDLATALDTSGVNNIQNSVFAKIQHVQNRYREATHQDPTMKDTEKTEIIESYTRLKEYITIFLGTDLTRSADSDAQLFGRRLGETKLSDGQKVLLQFCTLIHAQETHLSDLILFMDEPENHLHPAVLIEVIDKIQKSVTNGQIWIATHSIPLLSHFDPSYLWYMENGKISYAGKETERVLAGLLGDEDAIGRLSTFLNLPAEFASVKFAYECLLAP